MTDGLSESVTQADETASISVTLPEVKDEKGRPVFPSADRLGVVRLRPGEVAYVRVPTSPDLQKPVKAADAGAVESVVEYEVSETWGKRFGVASGKVRGTATK
jgi:hypothetical protein